MSVVLHEGGLYKTRAGGVMLVERFDAGARYPWMLLAVTSSPPPTYGAFAGSGVPAGASADYPDNGGRWNPTDNHQAHLEHPLDLVKEITP